MTDRTFTESIRVPSYLCAPDDQVGLDGVASLLQEAAWQHARRLGFAFTEDDESLFWVLHRIRFRFRRRPRWNEQVSLTTWPNGMERLYALRQFHIDGVGGERLVDVASAWIILDAVRRRPVRPEKHLPEDRLLDEELLAMPTGKTEAIPPEEMEGQLLNGSWRPVRPSDTDRNRHVNNARYAQWLLDGAPETLSDASEGIVTFMVETQTGQEFCVCRNEGRTVAEVWARDAGADPSTAVAVCRFNRR
jgi:medium-chain acyl-[acyl-carrier-protein] hydrolase